MEFAVFAEAIILGVTLSADSFSAALTMGNRPYTQTRAFKFAFLLGATGAFVAALGALAGNHMIEHFSAVDHWIAFGVLFSISIHLAYEGVSEIRGSYSKVKTAKPHSFSKLIFLSVATNIDALGVGLSLGITKKPLALYISSIGFCAFILALLGLSIGKRLARRFGPYMHLFGSFVLGILAFKMLEI